MMTGAERMQIGRLDDGRLHLNDGPIDLIVEIVGDADAVIQAENAAKLRFATILDELCAELALLRRPTAICPDGAVARRMHAATLAHAPDHFITPMAAVAGSVADEILSAITEAAPLKRAIVNNGGDIAFHLAEGETLRAGLVDRPDRPALFASADIAHGDGVCGMATSGWRGRSFSLGIADAVTVLAADAATADAAATIIANAVDLPDHPGISRQKANKLQPDSDLGDRLVTRFVGVLTRSEIDTALEAGLDQAERLLKRGIIAAAALHLCGQTRTLSQDFSSTFGTLLNHA